MKDAELFYEKQKNSIFVKNFQNNNSEFFG